MPRLYIKGIGLMVGMIVGAGMFGLPYAFSKAGLFWGNFQLVVSFLIILLLHLWYGEVSYYTKGVHRITGYTRMYLGKKAEKLAFITTLGAAYGSLLVYGLLGGIFLGNFFDLFNGRTDEFFSIFFFIVGGVLASLSLSKIGEINFILTVPVFGFIAYLLYVAAPEIRLDNFFNGTPYLLNKNWLLPYGVWLFSLSGFSVIPAVRDIFSGQPISKYKKVIIVSLFLAAFFYLIFVAAVLGVNGGMVSQDALSGMVSVLGGKALAIGSIIGFFAVFTSYIALAIDVKNIFMYDYKMPQFAALLAAAVPPVILYYIGREGGLVMMLSIIGSLGMGALGIFITLIRRKMVKILKDGDKSDLIAEIDYKKIKLRRGWEMAVLAGIIAAVAYNIWDIVAGFAGK
ncbi:MAG: hypothetical protein L6Q29_01385 [Candidatus Pacebacteria bacterium]|nr:hypothetical protein [Candidatus Paceibacterota bacterium]NUQ57237.1 hypothetical protein [Candidatus Paceibacter sp.]